MNNMSQTKKRILTGVLMAVLFVPTFLVVMVTTNTNSQDPSSRASGRESNKGKMVTPTNAAATKSPVFNGEGVPKATPTDKVKGISDDVDKAIQDIDSMDKNLPSIYQSDFE